MNSNKYFKIETVCILRNTYRRVPIRFLVQGKDEKEAISKFINNKYIREKFESVNLDVKEISKTEYIELSNPNKKLNDVIHFRNNNKFKHLS